MAYNTKDGAPVSRYVSMRKRIYKAQSKAKRVGVLYLLAILALAALACLPHFAIANAAFIDNISLSVVIAFFKDFAGFAGNELSVIVAGLAALMLLILLINALRGIFKLRWLFKRKASRLYGLNRNMYAMDDLGKIFSCSFASVVIFHFLVAVLVGEAALDIWTYALLGVGVFFHFLCGLLGGSVSMFDSEASVVEIKRECGLFAPFFRNLLQLAVVGGIGYFFLQTNGLQETLVALFSENGAQALTGNVQTLIAAALEAALLLVLVGMSAYATGVTEFDMDGAQASGRKCFLALSILALLCAGGAVVYGALVMKATLENGVLITAAIALVAVIFELALFNRPKVRTEDEDDDDEDDYPFVRE